VFGIDNLSPYYDVALKEARLALLTAHPRFRFARLDIANRAAMADFFARERFDVIVHLAAQAGVRYSIEQPLSMSTPTCSALPIFSKAARAQRVRHLVFASSSSVYGANRKLPFSEDDNVDHPISFYAATKKAQ